MVLRFIVVIDVDTSIVDCNYFPSAFLSWLQYQISQCPIVHRMESSGCIDVSNKESPLKRNLHEETTTIERRRPRAGRYGERNLILERRVCFIIRDNAICRNTEDLPVARISTNRFTEAIQFCSLAAHL